MKDRIEALEELLLEPAKDASGQPLSEDKVSSTIGTKAGQQQRLTSQLKRDSMVAASQISQKIKSTYRLKTSGRIFNKDKLHPNVRSELLGMYAWHKDGVWYITTSQKFGRLLIATASADGTACVTDMTTSPSMSAGIGGGAIPVATYVGHRGQSSVNCVKFHPKYDVLMTVSGDNTAHIWRPNFDQIFSSQVSSSRNPGERDSDDKDSPDTPDGPGQVIKTPQLELTGHTSVIQGCDFVSTVDQCVTASWDRISNIYDMHTGELVVQLVGHDQELTDVAAHPSWPLVATASQDSTFRLWDFREAIHSVCVFQGHSSSVNSTAFIGQDKVASGSDDRTVKVWDLKNMRSPLANIHVESPVNKLSVTTIGSSAGGGIGGVHHLIAIPLDNRTVRIYDSNGSRICRLPRSQHDRMVTCASFVPPGFSSSSSAASASTPSSVGQSSASSSSLSNFNTQLFTAAFDRRVCWWSLSPEKEKGEKEK